MLNYGFYFKWFVKPWNISIKSAKFSKSKTAVRLMRPQGLWNGSGAGKQRI